MSEDWTEKYRPKKLSDVIGNPSAVKDLERWALSWEKGTPGKRAAILIGSPGIGKTSSAIALANDMGWDLIEMNASDQRTAAVVKDIAQRASYFNSIGMDEDYKGGNRKKLIVMDEADNLFGNADRGALPAINELIKTTKQPVILIVNDFYALSKKSATVKNDTVQITYRKPVARSIAGALKKIAASEGISAGDDALMRVAENSNGDMRAAVRDLEALSHGRTELSAASAAILQERNVEKDMYSVLGKMFRENDPFGARKILSDVDIEPKDAMLWVDENLPYEYREAGDLVRGYEKLSRSDVFLGRVGRRQYFGLWAYASEMMTAGVAVSRMGGKGGYGQFRFPMYLVKMSRTKSVRALKSSLYLKIACAMHTSTKRVAADVIGPLKELAKNEEGIRIMLVNEMGLEAEELGFLLDAKIDSKIVKRTLEEASEAKRHMAAETVSVPEKTKPDLSKLPDRPERNEDAGPNTIAKKPVKNLFDF